LPNFARFQRVPNRFERGAVSTVKERETVRNPSVRRQSRRNFAVLRYLRFSRYLRRLPSLAISRFRRVFPDRSDKSDRRDRRRSSDAFPKISIDFHRQIEYH
jgi:hypothetical protein